MTHYGDPLSYAFGYGLSRLPGFFSSKYDRAKWMNDKYNRIKEIYEDSSLEAYEWRDKHSKDPVVGYFWSRKNAAMEYDEKKKYQADLKKNTGFNWKDNAYPLSAYRNAFGYSGQRTSSLFEVNDAVMNLYRGVKIW